MTVPAIEAHGLRRVYVSQRGGFFTRSLPVVALDGVELEVAPGETFGLLGPNGAGKTTMVKIMVTILLPTAGRAAVLGYDVARQAAQVRPRIGIVFGGERGLYWRLSGRDNLRYFAELYRMPPRVSRRRIGELIDMLGLTDRADDRVETYSRGMKQRLHIARGIIHDPPVVFMDEPTIGLDPAIAAELRQFIAGLRAQEKTVFLTTHYLNEAERLCDRVAVVDRGRLQAVATPARLKEMWGDPATIAIEAPELPPERLEGLGRIPGVIDVELCRAGEVGRAGGARGAGEGRGAGEQPAPGGAVRALVRSRRGLAVMPDVMAALSGLGVTHVETHEPTLEDAYLRIVRRQPAAAGNAADAAAGGAAGDAADAAAGEGGGDRR